MHKINTLLADYHMYCAGYRYTCCIRCSMYASVREPLENIFGYIQQSMFFPPSSWRLRQQYLSLSLLQYYIRTYISSCSYIAVGNCWYFSVVRPVSLCWYRNKATSITRELTLASIINKVENLLPCKYSMPGMVPTGGTASGPEPK